MKQDKNGERRDHDECSCSGTDTQNSENDENGSDGWQTMQEEECCSCCDASEINRDENRSLPNRDTNSRGVEEGRSTDRFENYTRKDEKNNKCKPKANKTRGNAVGAVEGECSRREQGNATNSQEECCVCQHQGTTCLPEEQCTNCDSHHRNQEDAQNFRKMTCSCVGEAKKINRRKRSRIHRRKNKKGRKNDYCSCSSATLNNQQYTDCCTCTTYNNMPEQGQAAMSNGQIASSDCRECSSDRNVPEVRYNTVSCQTCRNEDIPDGRETILLPRVNLRTSTDAANCEQCLRERTMFDRLSNQAVQSTIDDTLRKLIRKTLEMYPATHRTSQQAVNSFTNNELIANTNVGNIRPQLSLPMQFCTCTLKSGSNQSDTTCERSCTECAEVPPDCTCEECITHSQGNESCEECAQELREHNNACKLCVIDDETDESCEQCVTDSDNDKDTSDTCCECCKCHCWEKGKPAKDDDFLF